VIAVDYDSYEAIMEVDKHGAGGGDPIIRNVPKRHEDES
jgi:hypothetical protein